MAQAIWNRNLYVYSFIVASDVDGDYRIRDIHVFSSLKSNLAG